ncbi:hypothetical protein R1A27_00135 [Methylobacterium sp. NMS12]|uniref:hypothetical protein n=1 Tax=Methylobacterium sp. NMS12 TaxID=3079766 RepID=UPI003F8815C0
MSRVDENLYPELTRALIKQALGIINGNRQLVAEAMAEIAAIRAARSPKKRARGSDRRRTKPPPQGT